MEINYDELNDSLILQTVEEILALRTYLQALDEEKLLESEQGGDLVKDAIRRIICTSDGIKRISSVIDYIHALTEDEDTPRLGYMPGCDSVKVFSQSWYKE